MYIKTIVLFLAVQLTGAVSVLANGSFQNAKLGQIQKTFTQSLHKDGFVLLNAQNKQADVQNLSAREGEHFAVISDSTVTGKRFAVEFEFAKLNTDQLKLKVFLHDFSVNPELTRTQALDQTALVLHNTDSPKDIDLKVNRVIARFSQQAEKLVATTAPSRLLKSITNFLLPSAHAGTAQDVGKIMKIAFSYGLLASGVLIIASFAIMYVVEYESLGFDPWFHGLRLFKWAMYGTLASVAGCGIGAVIEAIGRPSPKKESASR